MKIANLIISVLLLVGLIWIISDLYLIKKHLGMQSKQEIQFKHQGFLDSCEAASKAKYEADSLLIEIRKQ